MELFTSQYLLEILRVRYTSIYLFLIHFIVLVVGCRCPDIKQTWWWSKRRTRTQPAQSTNSSSQYSVDIFQRVAIDLVALRYTVDCLRANAALLVLRFEKCRHPPMRIDKDPVMPRILVCTLPRHTSRHFGGSFQCGNTTMTTMTMTTSKIRRRPTRTRTTAALQQRRRPCSACHKCPRSP